MISNDLQWLLKSHQEIQNYYNQYNFYKDNSRTNQLTVLAQQKVR